MSAGTVHLFGPAGRGGLPFQGGIHHFAHAVEPPLRTVTVLAPICAVFAVAVGQGQFELGSMICIHICQRL